MSLQLVMHRLAFEHSHFFTGPVSSQIYTLSLHDALPICKSASARLPAIQLEREHALEIVGLVPPLLYFGVILDRKSTRLNSSHGSISYAVFCLKKKK